MTTTRSRASSQRNAPAILETQNADYPELYADTAPPPPQSLVMGVRQTPAGDAPPTAPRLRAVGPGVEEGRALWVSRFDFRTADDIRRLIDKAASANFNQIWLQVRSAATAFYRSALEPWDERLTGRIGGAPDWDPLGLTIQTAHQAGLEVHTWLNVYPAWQGATLPPSDVTPKPMFTQFTELFAEQWKQWDRETGPMGLSTSYVYASPGHWAVAERVTQVCRDLLLHYYLDGLHLDHVRYASSRFSWDPVTQARYAADKALEPDLTQPEWQRRQVTALVGTIHQLVRQLKPGLVLSAAVWPVYRRDAAWSWWPNTDGYSSYCQDSVGWLRQGLIDMIAPMLYGSILGPAANTAYFQQVVQAFAAQAESTHVYAGIGAEVIDAAEICRRIDITRTAGLPGQAIFRAALLDPINGWEALRQGPYQTAAFVPRPLSAEVGL